MIRNPAIARMHREITSLDDYEYFLDKFNTQSGIAEHFSVSGRAVSKRYLDLQVAARVEKKLANINIR